jgi:hypothetical protein
VTGSPRRTSEAGPHAGLPAEVLAVLGRALTADLTTITRDGRPITSPVAPCFEADRGVVAVSTGVTYPAKAERARRNQKVSLLFADLLESGLGEDTVVLVQGLAAVGDSDLQANTDRYVERSLARLPATVRGAPRWVLPRMDWYFARIWVELTLVGVSWWPDRPSGRHLARGVLQHGESPHYPILLLPDDSQAPRPGRAPIPGVSSAEHFSACPSWISRRSDRTVSPSRCQLRCLQWMGTSFSSRRALALPT